MELHEDCLCGCWSHLPATCLQPHLLAIKNYYIYDNFLKTYNKGKFILLINWKNCIMTENITIYEFMFLLWMEFCKDYMVFLVHPFL